jgi:hypothetical protein
MAQLSQNEFIAKHKTGFCLNLIFRDYHFELQSRKKLKQTGKLRFRDGQELPTPNEVVRELMKKVKGDYIIQSQQVTIQKLILSDNTDVQHLVKMFPRQVQQTTPPQPCTQVLNSVVEKEGHIKLAQALKLLGPVP